MNKLHQTAVDLMKCLVSTSGFLDLMASGWIDGFLVKLSHKQNLVV